MHRASARNGTRRRIRGAVSTLATGYSAPLQRVDFAGNASGVFISEWIMPFFPQGALSPGTLLAMVSAVYVKGMRRTEARSVGAEHDGRRDYAMLLGCLFLALVGAGGCSLDVRLLRARSRNG